MPQTDLPEVAQSQVTVRYFAAAAEAAGVETEQLTVADATLDGLRRELTTRYGEAMAKVLRGGSFLVAGRVRRDGGAILADDAPTDQVTVDVLPPFAGG